jgi:acyl-CoA synthetase (AMP-forming)/AMP-acid ligase II
MSAALDLNPTFLDHLADNAAKQPNKLACRNATSPDTASESLSYSELWQHSNAIALHLQATVAPNARVLLVFGASVEFITHFIGCLIAGMIPVPAPAPRINRTLARLEEIAKDCAPDLILTSADQEEPLKKKLQESPVLAGIRTEALRVDHAHPSEAKCPVYSSNSTAFIQYTSGSVSQPKGVIITHTNLISNLAMIEEAFEIESPHTVISWLPFFHDMGLITLLEALYRGHSFIFISPESFFIRPIKWLQLISQESNVISGGPNFAYDYCVKRIKAEQFASLDLSSWMLAYNGAEKVHAQTMAAFSQRFADCGFNSDAFTPCYGMAESTLLAACEPRTEPAQILQINRKALEQNHLSLESEPTLAVEICSSGYPVEGGEITILDPNSETQLPRDQIGEIGLRGPHISMGYWNQTDRFNTATASDSSAPTAAQSYFRTGDLGFMNEGRLYVTGRLKDMIIIVGKNYYPHDIESELESKIAEIPTQGAVAFAHSAEGATQESLVIVVEIAKRYIETNTMQAIRDKIRSTLNASFDLSVDTIVFTSVGSTPKTTSGKKQRILCRELFRNNQIKQITINE